MRIRMLCGMIMLSAVAQARPNQEVPKIEPQAQSYYQITQKEVAYEGKQYRLFLAVPKNTTKTTLIYGVDGNAQFPLMVNVAIKQKIVHYQRLLAWGMWEIKPILLQKERMIIRLV